jgi:DNA-binding beta-propeller fold protein YncE
MRREQLRSLVALGIALASAACENVETSTRALTAQSSGAQTGSTAGGSAASGSAATAPGVLAVCERPESVQFEAGSNAWYVSCMAKPDVAGDGFIAKLNAAGDAVVTERFSTGLNEPKGIRVRGGKLYVSDVTELITIDLATGRVLNKASVTGIHPDVPSSPFLNDVAVSEATGDVYVSDNRNDTLYRFNADGGAPRLLVKSPSLEAPNGLLVDERPGVTPRLLVAAMGPGLDSGRTDKFGAVLAIALSDLNDGDGRVEVTFVSQRIGNLDGIELDAGDLLVTDTYAGRLLRVSPTSATPQFGQGDARILRQGFLRSADLGFDPARRRVLVPQLGNGTVVAVDLGAS